MKKVSALNSDWPILKTVWNFSPACCALAVIKIARVDREKEDE